MTETPRRHPYQDLPDRQFWRNDPGIAKGSLFDPVSAVTFRIRRSDRVVSAGSCFAEHLGRQLAKAGFSHFITEPAHPMIGEKLARQYGYGLYAARYGNVYTARQLLQLLHRAFGHFAPLAVSWPCCNGRVVDPFRPGIQPQGFVSKAELMLDQRQHFAAIRRAVEEMDVFVFTLGLTEAWEDTRDGAIFPIAPGVSGGVWDAASVRFRNFGLQETAADLEVALAFIRDRNPKVRILLTVSPVPLNATYEDRHVWVSTTVSKAVLRLAAEEMLSRFADIAYFPSYEIITAPHLRGRYFAEDCRSVLPAGVDHVMRLFLAHFGDRSGTASPEERAALVEAVARQSAQVDAQLDVFCQEQSITNR